MITDIDHTCIRSARKDIKSSLKALENAAGKSDNFILYHFFIIFMLFFAVFCCFLLLFSRMIPSSLQQITPQITPRPLILQCNRQLYGVFYTHHNPQKIPLRNICFTHIAQIKNSINPNNKSN